MVIDMGRATDFSCYKALEEILGFGEFGLFEYAVRITPDPEGFFKECMRQPFRLEEKGEVHQLSKEFWAGLIFKSMRQIKNTVYTIQ